MYEWVGALEILTCVVAVVACAVIPHCHIA